MKRRAFTLVETIIATGVIMFGVLSILSLNTSSLIVTQVTEHEFMAAQFAREGIETVRAIRDANWLAYETDSTTKWNTNLSSGTDYTAILQDPIHGAYLDFTTNTLSDTCTGAASSTYSCAAVWRHALQDYYYQTDSVAFDPKGANVESTQYLRLITLNPICRANASENTETTVTSGSSCPGVTTQVGIHVISQVQYPSRGTTSTYTLEEYLYDWKY